MRKKRVYTKAVSEYLAQSHTVKLISIGDFEKMSPSVQEVLIEFYEDADTDLHRFGALLNSAFTQHSTVFMTSQRGFADLIKKDIMVKYKNCDYPTYNRIMHVFQSSGYLNKLRPSEGRRPALYELTEPKILGIMAAEVGKEVLSSIREKHISWYDQEYKINGSDNDEKERYREEQRRERDEFIRKLHSK